MRIFAVLLGCVVGSTLCFGQSNLLSVDISSSRSTTDVTALTDQRVRDFAKNAAGLTKLNRIDLAKAGAYSTKYAFALPTRVNVVKNGKALPTARVSTRSPGITLQFATGARAFPAAYQNLLQSVFDSALSTIDATFGPPAISGIVQVANYDDTIGDRDAVAGGYYLPNDGSGVRQIRFPVYLSNEAAAVNFIHCILLAYQSDSSYGFDAFQEGLVRATTMRVARQGSALPTLDAGIIANVLDNSYDVGPHYDWYNQKALGGKQFIASNLRDVPLPVGGSVGGIYLARYQMAGSAWQKVLAEYPTFIAQFNQLFLANPSAAGNVGSLVTIGQNVLNALRPGDPTIEGLSFANWYAKQAILETRNTSGQKLFIETVPITSSLATTDFGVFLIQTHFFETLSNGNENLLGSTSYPIFWNSSYDRILPSTQSEKMDIAGAYGSVTPNFENQNAGKVYRVGIDIPVQDNIVRTYVPAGAIATATQTTPNDFYGTITGVSPIAGSTLEVRVSIGSEVVNSIPVVDGAFGTLINTANYLGLRSVLVEVIRNTSGVRTVLGSRRINKAPGALAVDFRLNDQSPSTFSLSLTSGIQLLGLSLDPLSSSLSEILNIPSNQLLAARYNSSRANFDLYPNTGIPTGGQGLFVRSPAAFTTNYNARLTFGQALSVALKPGWNLVTSPLNEEVLLTNVQVVRTTGFPRSYADAVGEDVGADILRFIPGANDPISGVPEGGSFTSSTSFLPGRGYFVRCLAPEGATLLFKPNGFAPSAPDRSPALAAAKKWVLRAVVAGTKEQSDVILQESRTGTGIFDKAEDTLLPPGVGGLQASVDNNGLYYRETRRMGLDQIFRIRVDNCIPGKVYTLNLATLQGFADYLFLKDNQTGKTLRFYGGGGIAFFPKTKTQFFDVIV